MNTAPRPDTLVTDDDYAGWIDTLRDALGDRWDPTAPGGCTRRIDWPYPLGPDVDRGTANAVLTIAYLRGISR